MKNKKILFYLLCFILAIGITSIIVHRYIYQEPRIMRDSKEKLIYQEIAWKALRNSLKQKVIGSWENARVESFTNRNNLTIIPLEGEIDKKLNTKTQKIIIVSFDSINEAFLGRITIYIDPKTKKVLGTAPRM